MLRMLPGASEAATEGFLVSERRPGSPDGMPDGRADVRGPVSVHRKAAKTLVRETVRGPALPNTMVERLHPTSLSTTFGSTVRSCQHFLLLGGVSGPQSNKSDIFVRWSQKCPNVPSGLEILRVPHPTVL